MEDDMGEDGYSYGEEMDQPSPNHNMGGMGGMDEPYNDNDEEDESPQYDGEGDDDYGEEGESLQ